MIKNQRQRQQFNLSESFVFAGWPRGVHALRETYFIKAHGKREFVDKQPSFCDWTHPLSQTNSQMQNVTMPEPS